MSSSPPGPPTGQQEPGRPLGAPRAVGPIALIVIGAGLVARATLAALRTGGFQDFHVVDRTPDRVDDGARAEWSQSVPDRHAPRPQPAERRAEPGIEIHDPPAPGADWAGAWLAGCAVCLLCADIADPERALDVNARCLEYRVRLVPALVMGTVGQVGPLIEPGLSACLQCVDLRLMAATGRSCLTPFGPADPRVGALVGEYLAARATRLLTGTGERHDRRLTFCWQDGSSTDHPVLRSPHCPHCADIGTLPAYRAPVELEFTEQPCDPRRILELQGEIVDAVMGPIRSLEQFQPSPRDPPMQHWVASVTDAGWARFGHPVLYCGGNGLDGDRARAAALGEALERLSACQSSAGDVLVASYRSLVPDALDPSAWDLFDPATRDLPGFPYARVLADDAVSWIWGWSLLRARPVLVPASRVFMPFHPHTPADHADFPALSGFATGTSLAEAALAGALETVERDALMIAWANRLSPPRLELGRSSPGGVGAYVAAFEDADIEIRCSLVMLDLGAPVVLAIARGVRDGDPAVVLSAAAGLDSASACRRALAELAANRLNVRAAMRAMNARGGQEVAGATGHGLRYADPNMADQLDCWWNAPTTVALEGAAEPPRPSRALHRLAPCIAAASLETVVVDLTPPQIRDLGLSIAKVLVPGAYPLNFDARWPYLGGRRMRSAPVTSGLVEEPVAFEDLNRLPVPFP